MATINVNPYKNVELDLNEWEYEYVIDALMYYQYHAKLTDSKLKHLIEEIDLDRGVSIKAFQEKFIDSKTTKERTSNGIKSNI